MFRFLLLLIAVDKPFLVWKQHFQGNLVVLPFVAFSYTKIPSHWGIISVSENSLCVERAAKSNRRARQSGSFMYFGRRNLKICSLKTIFRYIR